MSALIKRTGQDFATQFLSWHDGVDAMLKPTPDSPMPNVLVHVAKMVNTPLGICSAGMILINPQNKEVPDFFGFVAENKELGQYYIMVQIFLKELLSNKLRYLKQKFL